MVQVEPERLDQPAFGGRISQPCDQANRRCRRASRTSPRSRSAPRTTKPRSASTEAGGLISASRSRPRPTCSTSSGRAERLPGDPGRRCRKASAARSFHDFDPSSVHSAINEVIRSLVEALAIVTAVVFLLPGLGALRQYSDRRDLAVADRDIHRPRVLGYSINLRTLLALVLPSVWSSTTRSSSWRMYIVISKRAWARRPAAVAAARAPGGPIIADDRRAGRGVRADRLPERSHRALFAESAFALVGAVTVSGMIALTLSADAVPAPARGAEPGQRRPGRPPDGLHRPAQFAKLRGADERRLHGS